MGGHFYPIYEYIFFQDNFFSYSKYQDANFEIFKPSIGA